MFLSPIHMHVKPDNFKKLTPSLPPIQCCLDNHRMNFLFCFNIIQHWFGEERGNFVCLETYFAQDYTTAKKYIFRNALKPLEFSKKLSRKPTNRKFMPWGLGLNSEFSTRWMTRFGWFLHVVMMLSYQLWKIKKGLE